MADIQTLFITNGPYAGRHLKLDETDAAAALADGWAVDTAAEDYDAWNTPAANVQPYPDSLILYLEKINNPEGLVTYHPDDSDKGEAEPKTGSRAERAGERTDRESEIETEDEDEDDESPREGVSRRVSTSQRSRKVTVSRDR